MVDTDYSVWLRTGSNPADINWFQTHVGKFCCYDLFPFHDITLAEVKQIVKFLFT